MAGKTRMFPCRDHGTFDPTKQWGCPDCVREMRHELTKLRTLCRDLEREGERLAGENEAAAARILELSAELGREREARESAEAEVVRLREALCDLRSDALAVLLLCRACEEGRCGYATHADLNRTLRETADLSRSPTVTAGTRQPVAGCVNGGAAPMQSAEEWRAWMASVTPTPGSEGAECTDPDCNNPDAPVYGLCENCQSEPEPSPQQQGDDSVCGTCGGVGEEPYFGYLDTCPDCKGTGRTAGAAAKEER